MDDVYELVRTNRLVGVELDNVFLDELYEGGFGLLHVAIRARAYDALAYLLLHDINVNMYNDDGDTPLLFAVKENDVQAVSILVQDARVNVNIKDVDGFDVIQLASSNRPEILRILLQGPAFELVDDNALQIAVRAGCVACVDLLLDFDVNVDDAMPLYRGPRSILKLLLDAGADAETALLVNVQQERYADIEWLLRRGVRVTPQVLFIASRDPMLTAVLHNGRSSEVIGG